MEEKRGTDTQSEREREEEKGGEKENEEKRLSERERAVFCVDIFSVDAAVTVQAKCLQRQRCFTQKLFCSITRTGLHVLFNPVLDL